jgi:hypothetical protein
MPHADGNPNVRESPETAAELLLATPDHGLVLDNLQHARFLSTGSLPTGTGSGTKWAFERLLF